MAHWKEYPEAVLSEDPKIYVAVLDPEDGEIGVVKDQWKSVKVLVSGVIPHCADDDFKTAIIAHILGVR